MRRYEEMREMKRRRNFSNNLKRMSKFEKRREFVREYLNNTSICMNWLQKQFQVVCSLPTILYKSYRIYIPILLS